MSKRLKKEDGIRQLAGLSQAEMAGMLGISREVLANYEAGHRPALPAKATLILGLLQVELNKPEHQPAASSPAPGETARQTLHTKLDFIVRENRFKAFMVQKQLDKCVQQQLLAQKRSRLVPCIEKVFATLLEQSKDSPWQPVSEHHTRWLGMAKELSSFSQSGEAHFIRQQLLELKYKMLVQEAEEAERMIAELFGDKGLMKVDR
jgi:transcriptional regulator with XRE-family HTH domain